MNDAAFAAQKRLRLILLAAAVGALALGVAAWFALVRTQYDLAERVRERTGVQQALVQRARAFLGARSDERKNGEWVEQTAREVEKAIPVGRNDLAVTQHLERMATLAGLRSFAYEVSGGIVVAAAREKEREKAGGDPLAREIGKLQSVGVTLQFAGGYRQIVTFLQAVADAPWRIDIDSIEMRRQSTTSFDVHVTMSTRYLHL